MSLSHMRQYSMMSFGKVLVCTYNSQHNMMSSAKNDVIWKGTCLHL